MNINNFTAHYFGLNFFADFFHVTNILHSRISEHKESRSWRCLQLQINRHLTNKSSFKDIVSLFNKIIECINGSHQLDNLIVILCIADKFYDHAIDSCLSSVATEVVNELCEILTFHFKRRFDSLSNVLILLEFHNERSI